jgi:hypothetical protein
MAMLYNKLTKDDENIVSYHKYSYFHLDLIIQLTRYLEFDGTMEKNRVNRSWTLEELRKYRKCSLSNDERDATRAKF